MGYFAALFLVVTLGLGQTARLTVLPDASVPAQYQGFVVLSDGRAFMAAADGGTLLFEPLTGRWSPSHPLPGQRSISSWVARPDGTVLVLGSCGAGSVDQWSAGSGWSALGSLPSPRCDGQVLAHASGDVSLAGGRSNGFTPSSEVWTVEADGDLRASAPLPFPLTTTCSLQLGEGQWLFSGGLTSGSRPSDRFFVFTAGGTSGASGTLSQPRTDHACARLLDGGLWVFSGQFDGGLAARDERLELSVPGSLDGGAFPTPAFDTVVAWLPWGEVLSAGSGLARFHDGQLWRTVNAPLGVFPGGHAIVLPTGRTLVVSAPGAFLIDEGGERASAGPELPVALSQPQVRLLPDGRVVSTAGTLLDGGISTQTFILGPGGWSQAGALLQPREGGALELWRDGALWLLGGRGPDGGSVREVERFEPATGQWSTVGQLAVGRHGFNVVTLRDGRFWLYGGSGTGTSSEFFDPIARAGTPGPSSQFPRESGFATPLPTGEVLVGAGFPVVGTFELFSVDAGFSPVNASALSPHGYLEPVVLPGGEDVLMPGGYDNVGAPIREVWRWNIASRTFTREADLPSNMGTVGLVLGSGRVLFAQGNFTQDALIYDPLTARWVSLPVNAFQNYPLPLPGRDGEVRVLGGRDSPVRPSARHWVVREEQWSVPRPNFGLSGPLAWPGRWVGFSGDGLRVPSRIGGSTSDQTGWDFVGVRAQSLETFELSLWNAVFDAQGAGRVQVPQGARHGWYWLTPVVHGVPGRAQMLRVGAEPGSNCRVDLECGTGRCVAPGGVWAGAVKPPMVVSAMAVCPQTVGSMRVFRAMARRMVGRALMFRPRVWWCSTCRAGAARRRAARGSRC